MPEIKNDMQTVTFSEIGGTVTRWQYRGKDGNLVDIFYPQQMVKRDRKMKLRGGMHDCFPNFGTTDPKYGLPQHGTLRNRKADEVTENGVAFRGTDLLGPMHDEECEVRIMIALTLSGFVYTRTARLIEPTTKKVFVNPGFHPYFRTPSGNAQAGAWGGQMHRFYSRKHGPTSAEVRRGADIVVPGIGKIQMMLNGAKRLYYWRDSRNYVCVEPVSGNPRRYGSLDCTRLTDEWSGMSCAFIVSLD